VCELAGEPPMSFRRAGCRLDGYQSSPFHMIREVKADSALVLRNGAHWGSH
jgi:hypothetical protein